ncbi:MAG: ATP-dependent Clp protease ATP-binding subunit [Patescibacteria group bacterium]
MSIICSHCEGKDKKCPVCHGLLFALALQGKFIFWQKNLSRVFIYNKKLLKIIKKVIDILLYIFMILGAVVVVYFLYIYLKNDGIFLDFFLRKNIVLTLFWAVLFVALYIFYRLSNEKESEQKVIKFDSDTAHEFNFEESDVWDINSNFEKINACKAFSFEALDIIDRSYLLYQKFQTKTDLHGVENQEFTSVFILYYLLQENRIKSYFVRLGIDVQKIKQHLEEVIRRRTTVSFMTSELFKIFLLAYYESYITCRETVGLEEIFIALSLEKSLAQEILFDLEIDATKLRNIVEWARVQNIVSKRWNGLRQRAVLKPKGEVNRAYTAVASPLLDQFSEDLTQYARLGYLEPTIGKEKEINSMFSLFGSGRFGVVLIGKPGTGKSFVVDSLAELMAAEEVPKLFQDKRLVHLSVSAVIAGAGESGAIEERLLSILKEVKRAGNIILFIDNIDTLVGLGTETSESLDIAELLSGELQKGYFLLVAATDEDKFKNYLSKTSLARILAKVEVLEPDRNSAIRILESKAPIFENKYNIYFTYQSLETAVDFSEKYIHNEQLPSKAISVMEQTAQAVRQERGDKAVISAEDVAGVISKITKIPVTKVTEIESKKLLNLEEEMHRRVVDQVDAVKIIAESLRRARANLRTGKRPIASFLFLGPTGVGKTEVAKTLADIYFGGENNMIRLDMSEYSSSDGISKLIGQAGDMHGGYLTNQVKERPFALVLLDEFEKADTEVHNLFLQVMEDGRLTDSREETIDFTNTIIIGTSNAGTDLIQQGLKNNKTIDGIKQELIENNLNKYFRPELINRFDGVVVFKPLAPEEVKQITVLMLNGLAKNIAEKGMEFIFTNQAVSEIAELGFDPSFGARPLRRVIQDKIENEIAKLILSKQVDRRDKIILNKIGIYKLKKL